MAWNMQPDLVNTEPAYGEQIYYQYYENSEIYGYPIKYIKAVEVESNKIFQESTARDFLDTNGFPMKMKRDEDNLYNGTEVFGGFGYTPSYNQIIYLSKKYFDDLTITPLEGDLIYDYTDNIFFQITKVDDKTEDQLNIRINDFIFGYRIYLKQYQFSYNDTFDPTLEAEIMDPDLSLEDLANLNLGLNTEIDNENVRDTTTTDEIFGELG